MNKDKICLRGKVEFHARPGTKTIGTCCKVYLPAETPGLYTQILDDLQNGIENPACFQCWDGERNNEISWRLLGNESYNNQAKFGYMDRTLEIGLENICDCACVYCSPELSSKFTQEYYSPKNTIKFSRWPITPVVSDVMASNVYDMAFNYLDNVSAISDGNDFDTYVNLIGGEPLLSKFVLNNGLTYIVERFYKNNNNKNLIINISTNCNTPTAIFNKISNEITTLHNKWPNFRIEAGISNESVGANSEYIRYGLSYDKFLENVSKWANIKCANIRFACAISPCSIKDTAEFIKQMIPICVAGNSIPTFAFNKIYQPSVMNITLLDQSFAHYLDKAVNVIKANLHLVHGGDRSISRLMQIKSELGSSNHKKSMIEMFDYIKLNRKLDIVDVNPELYNYVIN